MIIVATYAPRQGISLLKTSQQQMGLDAPVTMIVETTDVQVRTSASESDIGDGHIQPSISESGMDDDSIQPSISEQTVCTADS